MADSFEDKSAKGLAQLELEDKIGDKIERKGERRGGRGGKGGGGGGGQGREVQILQGAVKVAKASGGESGGYARRRGICVAGPSGEY